MTGSFSMFLLHKFIINILQHPGDDFRDLSVQECGCGKIFG